MPAQSHKSRYKSVSYRSKITRLGLISIGLSLGASALAAPPDAGALQQQMQQETHRLPGPGAREERPSAAPKPKPDGVTLKVRRFQLKGNTLVSSDKLTPVLAPFLDTPLDFAGLQAAAAAVSQAYRDAGWVANAFLPMQDIKDGQVIIEILEARLGEITTEGEPRRLKLSHIIDSIRAKAQPGQPLNATALDRALLLADDLPGVAVQGSLSAGKAEGETDLHLQVADTPLLGGLVQADNTGPRSTGQERASATVRLDSPFGVGDRLVSQLIHSQGSDWLSIQADMPIGLDGWRLGANASYFRYELIAREFKALDAKGDASTFGLQASYPIVRSRAANLYFSTNLDHRQYDNSNFAGTLSRYDTNVLTLGLFGNRFDTLGAGGATSANAYLSLGRLDLGSQDLGEDPKLDGGYGKLRYGIMRQQNLSSSLSLTANFTGQFASTNLDSSEKFYLGGAYGVRAYPANEGAGSEGQMLNLDLRWAIAPQFSLGAFFDWGHIRQNVSGKPFGGPNSYDLKGSGLGLSWLGPKGSNVQLSWARRIGSNPNPSASGKDQDGSLDKDRFWLTASLPF